MLMLAKNSCKTEIKPFRSALIHMKTRVNLKYFVTDGLSKPFSGSNLPQTLLNLTSFPISVTLMPFTLF